MSTNRLYKHYKKNQFWFWTAIELYGLAVFFLLKDNFFNEHPPIHSLLRYFDDPGPVFILGVIATFALVYSIWDIHWFYARPIMIMTTMFALCFFFGAFLVHDFDENTLSYELFLIGPLIARITSYAITGDD